MMTHIFLSDTNQKIIAAKGAPEAILPLSNLTKEKREKIELQAAAFASEGFRILAVGESEYTGQEYPKFQQELRFRYRYQNVQSM
jgi:Ca2+-transporting ATPase